MAVFGTKLRQASSRHKTFKVKSKMPIVEKGEIDVKSLSIGDHISIIIKQLGFVQIIGYQDMILFKKQMASEDIGLEIGLLYNRDINKEIVLDITNSGMADTTFIQENWFYYFAKLDF